jgi:hypothetical protein
VMDENGLDRSMWVPWYLPHWSSRAASAATCRVEDGHITLSIPPEPPLWAPDYPVQLQIAVFDFPDKGVPGETPVPELVVEHVLIR